MKKQKVSKQEEQEFFKEFEGLIKENAKILISEWEKREGKTATEENCAQAMRSFNEEKQEYSIYGVNPIINDLVSELKNSPVMRQQERKYFTRLKMKEAGLKLAKVATIALVPALAGAVVFGGLVVGGVALLGEEALIGYAAGVSVAAGAGGGLAIGGLNGISHAVDNDGIYPNPLVDRIDDKLHYDVYNPLSWFESNRRGVTNEVVMPYSYFANQKADSKLTQKYPEVETEGSLRYVLEEIETGRTMLYQQYVEARVYMAMRDICRERSLQEGMQEA